MQPAFTWGAAKAATNRIKHGVSFETAVRVFADPFALSEQDRIEAGEYRWQTIGAVEGTLILLVAHASQEAAQGAEVVRILSAREPLGRKGDAMSKKSTVSYAFDPNNPPPLTAEQKAEIDALARQPDAGIDTSDIPPLGEAFWQNVVRNPFYRPVKQQVTVRVDADVLAWLRSAGRGYQSKLNAILRQAMLREAPKG
jgi:uncharacterized protein (DUF4415 family)/uncharacterized DUF497 family protein